MARSKGLPGDLSGVIGPIVLKQYADKAVVTSRPDMSRVKRTAAQKSNNSRFARAVAYAKQVMADPVQRQEIAKRLKKGQTVYHAAVRKYLLEN